MIEKDILLEYSEFLVEESSNLATKLLEIKTGLYSDEMAYYDIDAEINMWFHQYQVQFDEIYDEVYSFLVAQLEQLEQLKKS